MRYPYWTLQWKVQSDEVQQALELEARFRTLESAEWMTGILRANPHVMRVTRTEHYPTETRTHHFIRKRGSLYSA